MSVLSQVWSSSFLDYYFTESNLHSNSLTCQSLKTCWAAHRLLLSNIVKWSLGYYGNMSREMWWKEEAIRTVCEIAVYSCFFFGKILIVRHEVSTELSVQQKKTERHAVESNVLLYDSKLAGKVKPDLICYCIKNKTITRSLFSVSPLACISIMTQ